MDRAEQNRKEQKDLLVLFGITIIIILLAIGLIIVILFTSRGEELISLIPGGKPCSNQQECGPNQYCDGNGFCQEGTGENTGESCATNADCLLGNHCINQLCLTPTENLIVGSFKDVYLATDLPQPPSGVLVRYYLHIDPGCGNSYLSQQVPSYRYNYTQTQSKLSLTNATLNRINGSTIDRQSQSRTAGVAENREANNQQVIVCNGGILSTSDVGDLLTLVYTGGGGFNIVHPCGSVLSYTTILPIIQPSVSRIPPLTGCQPNFGGNNFGTGNQTGFDYIAFFPKTNAVSCPATWETPNSYPAITFVAVK